jgi:toxin ParE1/3/4
MSARNRRLVITSQARSDLRHALLFSEQQWGKAQRREYERQIFEALANLESFPHLGRLRPEYGSDPLSFPVGQHVAIYQVRETEIRIVRLLHIRRDASSEFEAPLES